LTFSKFFAAYLVNCVEFLALRQIAGTCKKYSMQVSVSVILTMKRKNFFSAAYENLCFAVFAIKLRLSWIILQSLFDDA